jgi:hypothetical protein
MEYTERSGCLKCTDLMKKLKVWNLVCSDKISQPGLSCRNSLGYAKLHIKKGMNFSPWSFHHNNIPVHQTLSSSLWHENQLLDFKTPP